MEPKHPKLDQLAAVTTNGALDRDECPALAMANVDADLNYEAKLKKALTIPVVEERKVLMTAPERGAAYVSPHQIQHLQLGRENK